MTIPISSSASVSKTLGARNNPCQLFSIQIYSVYQVFFASGNFYSQYLIITLHLYKSELSHICKVKHSTVFNVQRFQNGIPHTSVTACDITYLGTLKGLSTQSSSPKEPVLQLPPYQKQLLATLYITMIYWAKSGWLSKDFPSSVPKL